MANNCHLENAPCLMAAVELNASCQIVAAAPVYTSEGMITFTPEIESEDGVDYSRLNWAGKRIGPATTGERAEKWWNLTGEIATKDWALFGMLTGNPVVLDGDCNVVGTSVARKLCRNRYTTITTRITASKKVCTTESIESLTKDVVSSAIE